MDSRAAKKQVAAVGLEIFYDTQWRSWGLIDPDSRVESLWFSPARFREMTPTGLDMNIKTIKERIAQYEARHS